MVPRRKRRLGLRFDFKVPLAVGEINELDYLECVDPCAKLKEINNFKVKRL
jgi:hypothetical protein